MDEQVLICLLGAANPDFGQQERFVGAQCQCVFQVNWVLIESSADTRWS